MISLTIRKSKKMLLIYSVILLTILVIPTSSSPVIDRHEVKPKHAQRFCGIEFVKVWKLICKLKKARGMIKRSRRSLLDLTETADKPKSSIFLEDEKDAKQFLKGHTRQRRQAGRLGGLDDATEECCQETCTYGEIAEYNC